MTLKRRRGFLIILSLLLTTLLLVVVLGYLGTRSLEFASTARVQLGAAAQALAEAGMEDARVKLEKDVFFPPIAGYGQSSYTYTEDLIDPSTSRAVGSYTVTVDTRRKTPPFLIYQVQSIGSVGGREESKARYQISAEIDCSPQDRSDPTARNPRLFRYINWREGDVSPPMPGYALPY